MVQLETMVAEMKSLEDKRNALGGDRLVIPVDSDEDGADPQESYYLQASTAGAQAASDSGRTSPPIGTPYLTTVSDHRI